MDDYQENKQKVLKARDLRKGMTKTITIELDEGLKDPQDLVAACEYITETCKVNELSLSFRTQRRFSPKLR